jgi:hypothetical protein
MPADSSAWEEVHSSLGSCQDLLSACLDAWGPQSDKVCTPLREAGLLSRIAHRVPTVSHFLPSLLPVSCQVSQTTKKRLILRALAGLTGGQELLQVSVEQRQQHGDLNSPNDSGIAPAGAGLKSCAFFAGSDCACLLATLPACCAQPQVLTHCVTLAVLLQALGAKLRRLQDSSQQWECNAVQVSQR